MDASNSIGEADFQKERDFVHSLAAAFTFGRNETAAGVITYSDEASLNIPLGSHISADRFRQAVESIPYILGRTRIDKALKLASTDIFSERGGTRPGFPKLMVILTDGVQTPDPDAIPLGEAVIPLQTKGVTIFAVGVGSKINRNELRSMVQRDDDVFTATDFDDLLRKAYQISERTCEDVKSQIGLC
jgi:collagen type VI alpha